MEGILIWSSRVVGDLDPRFVLRGIVVDVEIRTLIKSVMKGLGSWCSEIVMNVGKAMAVAPSELHALLEDLLRGKSALLTRSTDSPRLVAGAWLSVRMKLELQMVDEGAYNIGEEIK
jgi:hypothetical protein